MPADKPTMVAVRMKGRAEIFEFPTREAAELFLDEVRRLCPSADTAVTIDKEDGPHHERRHQLPRG